MSSGRRNELVAMHLVRQSFTIHVNVFYVWVCVCACDDDFPITASAPVYWTFHHCGAAKSVALYLVRCVIWSRAGAYVDAAGITCFILGKVSVDRQLFSRKRHHSITYAMRMRSKQIMKIEWNWLCHYNINIGCEDLNRTRAIQLYSAQRRETGDETDERTSQRRKKKMSTTCVDACGTRETIQ